MLSQYRLEDGRLYEFSRYGWKAEILHTNDACDEYPAAIHPGVAILMQYDLQNGAELLKSLCVFISNGHRIGDAAEELGIHRNSLRYRLDRIREISGIEPHIAGYRICFSTMLLNRQFDRRLNQRRRP
jgi:hypothetical protein